MLGVRVMSSFFVPDNWYHRAPVLHNTVLLQLWRVQGGFRYTGLGAQRHNSKEQVAVPTIRAVLVIETH